VARRARYAAALRNRSTRGRPSAPRTIKTYAPRVRIRGDGGRRRPRGWAIRPCIGGNGQSRIGARICAGWHAPHGNCATWRAAPVNSRMCRPVLARSAV
jgi:hypothetical protein